MRLFKAAAHVLCSLDSPPSGEEGEEAENEVEVEVEKQREMATTRKAGDHREQDRDDALRQTASACTAQALEPWLVTYHKHHRRSLSSLGLYTDGSWLG